VPISFDGYRPGALGGVLGLHMDYYAAQWGFGRAFEIKVATELAEFLARMDASRDLFLTAWRGDALAGSISMDVTGGGPDGAHLRWFVVSGSRTWQRARQGADAPRHRACGQRRGRPGLAHHLRRT
jgi:hypothetical protein